MTRAISQINDIKLNYCFTVQVMWHNICGGGGMWWWWWWNVVVLVVVECGGGGMWWWWWWNVVVVVECGGGEENKIKISTKCILFTIIFNTCLTTKLYNKFMYNYIHLI